MPVKKTHEVAQMSKLVHTLTDVYDAKFLVDLGKLVNLVFRDRFIELCKIYI